MNSIYIREKKRLFSLKRFRILAIAAYLGAVGLTVYTKQTFWNDIMYTFRIQDYVLYIFNAVSGMTVLLGLYRIKFTRNTIEQMEVSGGKKWMAVIAKWRAGISALFALYFIMALLIVAMSFIFGAGNSLFQIKAMLVSLLMDMVAAMACYSVAMVFLFLTAFWVLPLVVYAALMCVYPIWMSRWSLRGFTFMAYTTAKDAYSAFMLGRTDLKFIPIVLLYVVASLFLTMIIFKFKRKERRKLKDLFKKQKA